MNAIAGIFHQWQHFLSTSFDIPYFGTLNYTNILTIRRQFWNLEYLHWHCQYSRCSKAYQIVRWLSFDSKEICLWKVFEWLLNSWDICSTPPRPHQSGTILIFEIWHSILWTTETVSH